MDTIIQCSRTDLTELINDAVSRAVSTKPPLVMTKKQLAAHLTKPISTINRWMSQGMPYRKEGNEYPEFYRPQIEKWLHERFQNLQRETDNTEGQELVERDLVHLQAAERSRYP